MKAILYTGAALMIGAGIYGFADYKQTSRKKEFKTMYAEEKVPEASENTAVVKTVPLTASTVTPAVAEKKEEKKTTVVKKKTKKKKRTFNTRLFSRGALDEKYIAPPPVEIKTDKTKTGS